MKNGNFMDNYNKNELSGKITDKELAAFESNYATCENHHCGYGLTISKKENENKYIVFQCEYKSDEIIYEWDMDDIFNMSNEEFINKMRSGSELILPNHDESIYKFCKSVSDKCRIDGPLNVIRVNTSSGCNIKCKFCNIRSLKPIYLREKELYFNILEKIRSTKPNLDYLQLTGDGEPFIYKEETLKYIESLTADVCKILVIFSNCTLLDKDDITRIYQAVTKAGIKCQIMCSCSGITSETYEKNHGNNKFDKVVENIKLINEYNLLQNVNFVITPDNLHELEFYKQFWHEKGVTKTSATVIHDYCWPGATKFVYDSAEYKRFIENS